MVHSVWVLGFSLPDAPRSGLDTKDNSLFYKSHKLGQEILVDLHNLYRSCLRAYSSNYYSSQVRIVYYPLEGQ